MPVLVVILIVLIYLMSSIKILAEYERGVIFRLGRLLPQAKGPGVILVFAPIDRIVRISLRIDTIEVPPQDVITGARETALARRTHAGFGIRLGGKRNPLSERAAAH